MRQHSFALVTGNREGGAASETVEVKSTMMTQNFQETPFNSSMEKMSLNVDNDVMAEESTILQDDQHAATT